jgi:MFS transporter, putative metabolite:H+ symporter
VLAKEASIEASAIIARLDRLPASRYFWRLVVLLSLGAWFEIYDISLTASISPGLIRTGVFHSGTKGLFGLTDQATFAAATFLGLFIGTIGLASVADRFGRRAIFTFSLLWYAAATVVMAMQSTAVGVDFWRFIAGIGLGVEIVTIDTYITELVPKEIRGRAFAVNQFIQFTAVPFAAFLSWRLIPLEPLGMSGWRWVALVAPIGAIFVWGIRLAVPESPRWLAQRGRLEEAEKITAEMEARVAAAELGNALPEPRPIPQEAAGDVRLSEIMREPYKRRTVMLVLLNFFQAIGFFGFNNWVPALLASQGASFIKSLQYSFIIATVYPLSPLVFVSIADRIERKWQIVGAALGIAAFGLLFSRQSSAVMLITLGVLISASNNLLSFGYHAYQSELYPTRVRAKAIGFVYSFSRLSIVLSSFLIAFFLQKFGTIGVFTFIAFSMAIVVLSVGLLGPRTRGLALEEISH